MKSHLALLTAVFAVIGCEKIGTSVTPKTLDPLERDAAVSDAFRYLGNAAKIMAICGPSKGTITFLDGDGAKSEPDEISGGIIALGFDSKGNPDVVHRDALKKMIRVTEDSAEVTFVPQPGQPGFGTWRVVFPTTGIVEQHSLVKSPKGQLFDLWTSTRSYGLMPARSLAFVSKCEAL